MTINSIIAAARERTKELKSSPICSHTIRWTRIRVLEIEHILPLHFDGIAAAAATAQLSCDNVDGATLPMPSILASSNSTCVLNSVPMLRIRSRTLSSNSVEINRCKGHWTSKIASMILTMLSHPRKSSTSVRGSKDLRTCGNSLNTYIEVTSEWTLLGLPIKIMHVQYFLRTDRLAFVNLPVEFVSFVKRSDMPTACGVPNGLAKRRYEVMSVTPLRTVVDVTATTPPASRTIVK